MLRHRVGVLAEECSYSDSQEKMSCLYLSLLWKGSLLGLSESMTTPQLHQRSYHVNKKEGWIYVARQITGINLGDQWGVSQMSWLEFSYPVYFLKVVVLLYKFILFKNNLGKQTLPPDFITVIFNVSFY